MSKCRFEREKIDRENCWKINFCSMRSCQSTISSTKLLSLRQWAFLATKLLPMNEFRLLNPVAEMYEYDYEGSKPSAALHYVFSRHNCGFNLIFPSSIILALLRHSCEGRKKKIRGPDWHNFFQPFPAVVRHKSECDRSIKLRNPATRARLVYLLDYDEEREGVAAKKVKQRSSWSTAKSLCHPPIFAKYLKEKINSFRIRNFSFCSRQ